MHECLLYNDPELYDSLFPTADDGALALNADRRERLRLSERFYREEAERFGGRVLELGCGSGRLTIPLAQSGVDIVGADLSTAMLQRAAAKAHAAGVHVEFRQADIRAFDFGQTFRSILIPGNTLLHLLSPEDWKRCLRCVRRHLAEGGRLIFDVSKWDVEVLARGRGQRYPVMRVSSPQDGEIEVEESASYDQAAQVREITWFFSKAGAPDFRAIPYRLRVVFPLELTMLLEAEGFRLQSRYGEFTREPFVSSSPRQVCVCETPQPLNGAMTYDSKTWVPAGHFYSPLVDPTDAGVTNLLRSYSSAELESGESLRIDDKTLLETFEKIRSVYKLLPFTDNPTTGFRYYYDNPAFSYGDAITYFGILHAFKPKRVIEIGSGFSSCLLMDTNDKFLQGRTAPTFIEPYPDVLFSLLQPRDPYRKCVMEKRLQDVKTSIFRELEPNDILFVDSSHVLKTGSDVCDYLFRIFPLLPSGALIHIHDIFYPFDYGSDWIVKENRSWNESYAIHAFLQYNNRFEILYFNHYMYKKYSDLLKSIPLFLRNCGGSLWLRKR